MKTRAIWIIFTVLLLISLVLASCTTSTTPQTISTTTQTTAKIPSVISTTSTATAATRVTTTSNTSSTGKWWDKIGKPQYGGAMTLRINRDIATWDPYQGDMGTQLYTGWIEQLFTIDWTIDPAVQSYKIAFWGNDYAKGQLIESWEFTSPGVFVVHVRKGIHWQDISPANAREFTADDIVFHFNRNLGLGNGFTKPAPNWGSVAWTKSLLSVTAIDKYTFAMKWNTPNPEFVTETFQTPGSATSIENPDAVKQWGDVLDWHHAIGTGPFILYDYVSGSSATLNKNPNYWGFDERYPQNQLPYVDKLKYLIIPDDATALAALRTGKIDIMDGMQFRQAQSIKKTNPEILQTPIPQGNGNTIDPRNDLKPFSDIRIREALQLAINLTDLANSYYGGASDPWPCPLTSNYMTGWGFPYNQWPQDLKDEYAYNPTLAKKLLVDAGYPAGFKTDIVVSSDSDTDLLQVVKSYFMDIGIDMEIRVMDTVAWSAFVVTSHKNDAMATRAAGNLGLSFYPLRQFNRFQLGQAGDMAMVNDPVFDAFYTKALAATSTSDIKKILTDANTYVARQHFAVSLLQPMTYSLCQPWLNGFNAQYGSSSYPNGPQLLFFYGARFWIDQGMKKSMGG